MYTHEAAFTTSTVSEGHNGRFWSLDGQPHESPPRLDQTSDATRFKWNVWEMVLYRKHVLKHKVTLWLNTLQKHVDHKTHQPNIFRVDNKEGAKKNALSQTSSSTTFLY